MAVLCGGLAVVSRQPEGKVERKTGAQKCFGLGEIKIRNVTVRFWKVVATVRLNKKKPNVFYDSY